MALDNNINYKLGTTYILLGLCLLIGFFPWQLAYSVSTQIPKVTALALACNVLIRLAVILALTRATVREPTDSRRRTWGTLLAALSLDFAAICSFIVARSGGDSIAGPIISPLGDSLQISAYVMVVVALRSMRIGTKNAPDWRLPTLDTLTTVLALSSLVWLLVISRQTQDATSGLPSFILQLGYPLLDIAMVAWLLLVLLRPNPAVRGRMLRGIAVFISATFVADGLIGAALYLSPDWGDTLFALAGPFQGAALAGLILATQSQRACTLEKSTVDTTSTDFSSTWTISAVSAFGLYFIAILIVVARSGITLERITIDLVLLISMSLIGTLFLIRQSLVTRQTRRTLEATVALRTRELEAAREELARSHASLRSLTDKAPIGIAARSPAGVLEYTNPHWETLISLCPNLANWAPEDTGAEDYLKDLYLTDETGAPRHFYAVIAEYLDMQGNTGGVWIIVTDVTERKLAETQLSNLAKLASLGEMSTGLAHELNQPLQGIRLVAANLKRLTAEIHGAQPAVTQKFQRLDDLVERAGNLVARMRSFGRIQKGDLAPVDLGHCLQQTVESFKKHHFTDDVSIRIELPDQPAVALGEPQMIDQIVASGLSNALDAVRSTKRPGEITVALKPDQEQWLLQISDNGPGIAPDLIDRVMEPFFTTKPVNEGVGLGLSLSNGLATSMGAQIGIANGAQGAVLTLQFPSWEPVAWNPKMSATSN